MTLEERQIAALEGIAEAARLWTVSGLTQLANKKLSWRASTLGLTTTKCVDAWLTRVARLAGGPKQGFNIIFSYRYKYASIPKPK